MAKVIQFYVWKNLRKPSKWVPRLQCGKVIEFCSRTKKSAGIGFELIREKANEVYRTRATTDGPIRDFILTGRHFVGRVEELAMSLFDSLYNSFASFECGTNFRTWRFRTLKNTFSVMLETGGAYDRCDGLGGGRT